LLAAPKCGTIRVMSKKRVTLVEKDTKQSAKVYPNVIKKRGKKVLVFIVRGWKVDGKWQRKKFVNEADADSYAASVNVNLHNEGKERSLVLTTLAEADIEQAERAVSRLKGIYGLDEVVDFYLKHHSKPGHSISLQGAINTYLDHKEGVMKFSTWKSARRTLRKFAEVAGNIETQAVTEGDVTHYLKSLRDISGLKPAKRKTWNNERGRISAFLNWAMEKDKDTQRPYIHHNPVADIRVYDRDELADQSDEIVTTDVNVLHELMSYVMHYKGGKLAKYYALAYFAGIRPGHIDGEMLRLSEREHLIEMQGGTIKMLKNITKDKRRRIVNISKNLRAWLEAYEGMPIVPPNLKHECAHIRKKFGIIQRDETRHSFISYLVAMTRSVGDTALQVGNSESIIRDHYLDERPFEQAANYFAIFPDLAKGEAVIVDQDFQKPQHLRVI